MADKYKSTLLAQNNTPEEIQKADLDLLKKINEVQASLDNDAPIPPPIGYVYWQLPGKLSPLELWPGLNWTNISSLFAGDFFRAEGGDALSFEAGRQAHQLQDHKHNFSVWSDNPAECDSKNEEQVADYVAPKQYQTSDPVTGNHGTETRPVNQTIRLWERTA